MISLICPVLNEEKYIKKIIDFYKSIDCQPKELLIIDGGSEDKTVQIIKSLQSEVKDIHLIFNNKKYVPFALNIALKECRGEIIIRLDAHTSYAPDYVQKIIETFKSTSADIVGGPMNAVGDNSFQLAVAAATSTKFGIGDSKLHDINYRGYSDHVYLGAWKRELFDDIGYFDERLFRNQDDEFHYRANSKGKKIYQNPDIKSYYYPRSSFLSLFKQYFQYGLFKPLVLKKIHSQIKVRHLIPALFVLYLCTFPLWFYEPYLAIPALIYLILNLWFSFKNHYNYRIKLLAFLIYPILHIAYGTGTIIGVKKFFKRPLREFRIFLF